MAIPVVAIVGRPNVGKSSLFNALIGRRTSIVEPTAGVTRDRVSAICEFDEVYLELVDTGGHGIVDRDDLGEHVERQILYAIDQAQLILLVVDGQEGLTPLDRDTAELLRRHGHADRVRLVANKVDAPHLVAATAELGKLGFGEAMPVSAIHGHGRADLRDLIRDAVRGVGDEKPDEPVIKIALIGRRNVGKSSFINALVGEERVIVSEVPGTTRDSIDVRIEKDGRTILCIDTAGLRKKARIDDAIELYAYSRVTRSIQQADVVLFLLDAAVPVGQVDKSLAHLIAEEYKPCVLVVNKWDLAKGKAGSDDYGEYLTKTLPELDYAPVAFTCATAGRNLQSTIDLAAVLFKQARTRVPTSQLNEALRAAVSAHSPKAPPGRKALKLLYAAQVSTEPPTIVVFANQPDAIGLDYQRYLANRFREMLPYPEIPIRFLFRARRSAERAR